MRISWPGAVAFKYEINEYAFVCQNNAMLNIQSQRTNKTPQAPRHMANECRFVTLYVECLELSWYALQDFGS